MPDNDLARGGIVSSDQHLSESNASLLYPAGLRERRLSRAPVNLRIAHATGPPQTIDFVCSKMARNLFPRVVRKTEAGSEYASPVALSINLLP